MVPLSDIEIGFKKIEDGNNSDLNLFNLLIEADKSFASLKLLRFAASNAFRDQIISVVDSETVKGEEYDFLGLIDNSRIKNLEVLLINPMCTAFLSKLDSEKRSNWQITRIKEQIIKFIEGFIFIKGKHKAIVGIYECTPIWNLGILEKENFYSVLVRSYGLKGQIKGHKDDTTKEIILDSGAEVQLAESFVNYFNFIKNHQTTKLIKSKAELSQYKRTFSWPSLFKGNALKFEKGQKQKKIGYIAKVFNNKDGKKSELEWYRLGQKTKSICRFFNMPMLDREFERIYKWRGDSICIEYISGVNVFELVSNLQIYDSQNLKEVKIKCSIIIGFIIDYSYKALLEFRQLYTDSVERFPLKIYPFYSKLTSAIKEIKDIIPETLDSFYDELNREVEDLANILSENSVVPFRDAHLKNRILKSEFVNISKLIKDLLTKDEDYFINEFQNHLFDFDFETAQYKVTEWDDLCHLFLFENIGLFEININNHDQAIIEDGKALIYKLTKIFNIDYQKIDSSLFWDTLLFRSIREYCRRVWYYNIMPNTYKKRYGFEGHNYYLTLAIFARIQTTAYPFIQKLLNIFQAHSNIVFKGINKKQHTTKLTPIFPGKHTNTNCNDSKDSVEESIKEIKKILEYMIAKDEDKGTIAQKINEIVQVKPSFFGLGFDVNALVDIFLKKGNLGLDKYLKKRINN